MVSWQVPHLAKGCRPNFNNGLRGDPNSGPILPPRVYSSLTRIMAPLQAISILHQMELHLFMSPTYVFWNVPYLAKGCRPDFKNSLRGDSNSGPILAPLSLFESDSNNGPSPGHSNMELQTLISPKAILSQL